MATYASEEFITQHTGKDIATVRNFVCALCDYHESGEDAPFNRHEAVKYISRSTNLDVGSIVIMYVLWVTFMTSQGIVDQVEHRDFRKFTDLICDVNGL